MLSTLGAGTFGQVVKCRLQETGEEVAVKVIKNQQAFYCQARATRMPHAGHAEMYSPAFHRHLCCTTLIVVQHLVSCAAASV